MAFILASLDLDGQVIILKALRFFAGTLSHRMKHIKKRFLLESDSEKIDFDNSGYEVIDIKPDLPNKILSTKKNHLALVQTDRGKIYGGFVHNINGKNLIFPIPDPTLIYFNNAQQQVRLINELKKRLIDKVDYTKSLNEPALNEIYHYYGTTSGFVIFLFTSIESFINQQIPDDFIYRNEVNRKTELYNRNQIQEFLDFDTKLKKVLKQATGKDFFNKPTSTNQLIFNLKAFRDDIIHTKAENNPFKYDRLIKTSLNFKYEKTLDAVAAFMNFYKTDYIIECDCGKDF